MAHTWLHLGTQVLGTITGGALGPGSQFYPGMPPGAQTMGFSDIGGSTVEPSSGGSLALAGACPPQKTRTLTIDCATGLEIKRKRRRRRALLTQGDMGVLFQIASLPNNANVRVALAGAIRR